MGATEEIEVAYCLNQHGTRTIPEGTIKGLHVTQTPDYLQLCEFLHCIACELRLIAVQLVSVILPQ